MIEIGGWMDGWIFLLLVIEGKHFTFDIAVASHLQAVVGMSRILFVCQRLFEFCIMITWPIKYVTGQMYVFTHEQLLITIK